MEQTLTQPIITNPYVAHHGFAAQETALLVTAALLLGLLGLMLAEDRFLGRVSETIERVFAPNKRRTVRPV